MDPLQGDLEISLEGMKARIDRKVNRIMSLLSLRHEVVHSRTQTEPDEKEDELQTMITSKDPEAEKRLIIQGFPLTSRNDEKTKQRTLGKTYTTRQTLNKKKTNSYKLNTTSSTVHNTSVNIAHIIPDVKIEKRSSKPEQSLKKKKAEEHHIARPSSKRVEVRAGTQDQVQKEIQNLIFQSREQDQDSYIRRHKMLERIAKLTEKQSKK